MELLENPNFKLKYQKSKYKVKIWESEFVKINGRNPSKNDIKDAALQVREAYKTYYKLKTLVLQDSLMDITFSEDENPCLNITSTLNSSTSETLINSNNDEIKHSPIVFHDTTVDENVCVKQVLDKCDPAKTNVVDDLKGVWGPHLNKEVKQVTIDKKLHQRSASFGAGLSQKLFAGSAFNKRNPRKSFSFTRPVKEITSDGFSVESVLENGQSLSEQIPTPILVDLNTIVQFPDEAQNVSTLLPENHTTKTIPNFLDASETCKIIHPTPKLNLQNVSAIQRVLNSSHNEKKYSPSRNIDKGWLERCTKFNSLDKGNSAESSSCMPADESKTNDATNADKLTVGKEQNSHHIESDEDLVYSSGDERESVRNNAHLRVNSKRKFSFEGKKEILSVTQNENSQSQTQDMLYKRPKYMQKCQSDSALSSSFTPTSVSTEKVLSVGVDIERLADAVIKKEKCVPKKGGRKTGKLTKKEILEKKMGSGQANENFVKINLKKKIYVRGKTSVNFSKYKKNEWKKKKKAGGGGTYDGPSKEMSTCFKCGDIGHWAQECKNHGDKLLPEEENVVEESQFPTLEEVESMCSESQHANKRKTVMHFVSQDSVDETNPAAAENLGTDHLISNTVEPLYKLNENGSVQDTPSEVYKALKLFGHTSFRPGQEEAVMRILSGLSTLVTLSTGSGKSLCYQLPAYLLAQRSPCITLVVSPLVSLMEDQVIGVANCLKAACLHTNQTKKQRLKVMELAKSGDLHILLVSPEAVVSGDRATGFGSILKELPAIGFACIDEAHCVSQWSHNFRPSYLMICRVLRERLGVKTVLGLTATATKATCSSIVQHLNIPDGQDGVIKDIPLPNNLILSVSKDKNRDTALMALLKGSRFQDFNSIIIYCTRQAECERLAALIRTCLQDTKPKGSEKLVSKSKLSWNSEAYHAGLNASKRKQIQAAFMSGQLRIVVATVAFGMGINKQDIRAVLHYNMPHTFESYVQEIGRAGRDGLPAHCHLFLDSQGGDRNELRRHIYANSVDRHNIRKLLQRVFVPCKCTQMLEVLDGVDFSTDFSNNSMAEETIAASSKANEQTVIEKPHKKSNIHCPGHEIAFVIDETVQALDLPQENISTMLCYLELHEKKWIKVLSPVYTVCKVMSYKGVKGLKEAAKLSPPLAMAIALDQRRGISYEKTNILEFPVVEIATAIGWDSGMVKSQLKNLEWKKVGERWQRTGLTIEFTVLGFRIRAPGNLGPAELDDALDTLVARVNSQENIALLQLQTVFKALTSISYSTVSECIDDVEVIRSDELKRQVREYFDQEEITMEIEEETTLDNEEVVVADVRNLVCSYRDQTFTGRAVARIFYGISSPCFPAIVWGRCRHWRAHLRSNFKLLCHVATREILRLR